MFALPLPAAVTALVLAAGVIMFAGPRMVRLADRIADVTGLGEVFVGAVLVGATTSLPDILATVLPNGLADVFYREGSIYAAVGDESVFAAAVALVATAIVTPGLLRRERHGLGNIGLESTLVLVMYALMVVLIV